MTVIPEMMTEYKKPDSSDRMIKLIQENLNLIKENTQLVMRLDARIRRMEQMMGVPGHAPLMMKMIPERDMAPEYKEPEETKIRDHPQLPHTKSVMDLTGNRDRNDGG